MPREAVVCGGLGVVGNREWSCRVRVGKEGRRPRPNPKIRQAPPCKAAATPGPAVPAVNAPPGPRQAQSDAPVFANASPRARISRRALLLPAGHRHLPDQDRAGVDVRTRVDVTGHRLDVPEHRLEVARNGEAIDGVRTRPDLRSEESTSDLQS